MNKFPIEISGTTYEFTVNRNVLRELEGLHLEKIDSAVTGVEDMFHMFLKPNYPEMSKEESLDLLNKAEDEYGFGYISSAMNAIAEMGFTTKPVSTKTIPWLEK